MNFSTDKLSFKGSRVLSHLLFWIAYVTFFLFQYSLYSSTSEYTLSTIGKSLLLTSFADMTAAYFTVYYLLPKYLLKKRYFLFALGLILSAALVILFQRVLLYYISYPHIYHYNMEEIGSFWRINPFYSFINIYSVVALFTTIKLLKYWFKNQQLKSELENKNKTSELALLRSQLNPHFLFNTLNNIDSLILTNQEKASDAIIKLSDILRFIVYDATDIVPVDKEINYLKSYISLQQLRLKDPDFVSFKTDGNCIGKTIAPMLFIPFIENAFKHGLKNVDSPGIDIRLDCNKNSINFEVINHFDDEIVLNKDNTSGIGLVNTKRRLELLYPGEYELTIKKQNGYYKTSLIIYR